MWLERRVDRKRSVSLEPACYAGHGGGKTLRCIREKERKKVDG